MLKRRQQARTLRYNEAKAGLVHDNAVDNQTPASPEAEGCPLSPSSPVAANPPPPVQEQHTETIKCHGSVGAPPVSQGAAGGLCVTANPQRTVVIDAPNVCMAHGQNEVVKNVGPKSI